MPSQFKHYRREAGDTVREVSDNPMDKLFYLVERKRMSIVAPMLLMPITLFIGAFNNYICLRFKQRRSIVNAL